MARVVAGATVSVAELREMYGDNPYVECIDDNGHFRYHEKLFIELGYKLKYGGMRQLEALETFGLDSEVIGENRAYQVARKAIELADKLIKKDFSQYDSELSAEEMLKKRASGEYDDDDLMANLLARVLREDAEKAVKKNRK